MTLLPDSVAFCLISFEGPDQYAQAGGLGIRISQLADQLASSGYETHLIFVGDPAEPAVEARAGGKLTLHRWCQWISTHHPAGVYDGEERKLADFNDSAPPFILEQIVKPILATGRMPVLLAEEWHTAEALIRLDHLLKLEGIRPRCVLFWNANNNMSFHRVDWQRLSEAAQLTTVSRYMKHLMWGMGLNPLVIPNGIPSHLLEVVPKERVRTIRRLFSPDDKTIIIFKLGRFDPAKRWMLAVESAAMLKARGFPIAFVLRGGVEQHGAEVMNRARQLGLTISDVYGHPKGWDEMVRLLEQALPADIYQLQFFMTQEMLRPFYAASDAVLANSGHEPFGLFGLEAMAAAGLTFTGATGEEYALYGQCAVVLDTDSPDEIVGQLLSLKAKPKREAEMRRLAVHRAADFIWERVILILLDKVKFVAQSTHVLPQLTRVQSIAPKPVRDVVIYTVVHQPRRLRLPASTLNPGDSPRRLASGMFDERMNERYFRKVSQRCYYPAAARFRTLLDQGLKLAIGFSLSFVEQAMRWDEGLLDIFRRLVAHPNVELVAVEPTHSFLLLWDIPRFISQMLHAADRLEQIFGVRPVTADTTEMMMSDTIYHALDVAGFKAGFIDGRPWVMEWRQPTYLYHHDHGQMKLLARHYRLSDDVGYRFSDRNWDGWPLKADRYAQWLAAARGDLVVLGWDFETFGEHHPVESGIFEFLAALPSEAGAARLSFITPSEAVSRYQQESHHLPLPAFASTWAGSGGMDFFLGNPAQQAVFQLMMQAYHKACLTGNHQLIELALWLAQSDNLHLIQWYGRSGADAEVSAYFTPKEWWALGGDRIITEIQQVYRNFIDALDPHLAYVAETSRMLLTLHDDRSITETASKPLSQLHE